ncbi:NUDIX domain-containing protein [Pseudolysinimonas sp.]|jgi:8-oxo-dGTP pyrophosphatase MutT (NUDIX family)|uniref:NUDIX domain-containing protein n=1 Tax=Pseudolysinimonas sp. TaxID=2680009 RepID=UPI0037837272
MGTWNGRLGVVEFATAGTDLDTARIVAARIAILEDDGAELARWDWGSDRAEAVVGEVVQTLRVLMAVGIPIATFDAAAGLTVLDRECRRRQITPWDVFAPVLDPLLLDEILDPAFDGRRSLNAMAERYGVAPGSLAAGRIVREMLARDGLDGSPAHLHDRQRRLDDEWPVAPLDDIRLIEDTQPIPAPAPRPSGTVPVLDFTDSIPVQLEIEAPEEPVEPIVEEVVEGDVEGDVERPPASRRIHVAAAIVTDTAGRAVVVRKRGTTGYMQPGGKIERGESALSALIRELREELGLEVDVDATEFLGSYEAAALNEPGRTVRAEVFALVTDSELHPAAEIDALHWLESPTDVESVELAPLTLDVMLPLWAARRPALF